VALLQACGSSQSSVYTALQGSDREAILETLAAAHRSCKLAAAKLRKQPIPTINSREAANGVDQITVGLDQIAAAVRIIDSSPTRAKAKAQAGMKTYKLGLDHLTHAQLRP
jgi:hypothetical protein